MDQIGILEKTFNQQVKLLQTTRPFKNLGITATRDILARVYGYRDDLDFREHSLATTKVDQSIIQNQLPNLINRLSSTAGIDGQVAKHIIKKLWPSYVTTPLNQWRQHQVTFVFYGKLLELLKRSGSECTVTYRFDGIPSIKDAIEAQGIPHTEVAVILRGRQAVNWGDKLIVSQTYSVYPANYRLNNTLLSAPRPATGIAFALDVHLGKLARYLRMLGFDTYYMKKDKGDKFLIQLGEKQNRIVLTRDKELLKHSVLKYGYWLRHRDPDKQLLEVLDQYQLSLPGKEFSRCLECNAVLTPVEKQKIQHRLPPAVVRDYHEFNLCEQCEKIYWKGSHFDRMQKKLKTLTR